MKNHASFFGLLVVLVTLTHCKASRSASENELLAVKRPICCRYLEKQGGIVDEEYEVSSNFSRQECQRHLRTSARSLSEVHEFGCEELANPERWNGVEVCYSKTHFNQEASGIGFLSDAVAYMAKLGHAWIRTPQKEVGLGNRNASAEEERSRDFSSVLMRHLLLKGLVEKVNVRWTDHSDYGVALQAECIPIYRCSLSCVNDRLQIGKGLGIYSIFNQCHSVVTAVLKDCGCVNRCIEGRTPAFLGCSKWAYPPLHLEKTTE